MLIDYLISKGYTHKKAKLLLTNKQVFVNNKIVTKYNYLVKEKDFIEIKDYRVDSISDDIDLIYEDKDIIVVNKNAGLLTIASDKEKDKTLYHIVGSYLKRKNKNAKVFIIHRLDKDTSGIVILAKNEHIKNLYQDNWNSLVKYRGYIAVVEGIPSKKEDTIKLKLDDSGLKTYVSKNGRDAITRYKVLKSNDKYSLLDIEIKTGRKNQIRTTMSYLGNPILGDSKYGSHDNSLKRLALHAYKLSVINPITKKEMDFLVDIPNKFNKIVK